MATTSSSKILAWLNMSKSTLKVGQTEQLTIEFSQDPGALSLQDFTVTGGVLSNLEGAGLERTLIFTAGSVPGPASVSVMPATWGDRFQMIPSGPLQILPSSHYIDVQQVVDTTLKPAAPNIQQTGAKVDVLSGRANPNSTIKLLFDHGGGTNSPVDNLTTFGKQNSSVSLVATPNPLGVSTVSKLVSTLQNVSTLQTDYRDLLHHIQSQKQ